MKNFFDTNVFTSALISDKGVCAGLYQTVSKHTDYELVICEVVLNELEEKLSSRFKMSKADPFLAHLRQKKVHPTPEKPADYPIRDPDDAWVLASALEGKADVLVTGDKDLLELAGEVRELKIMSPREFMDQFNTPESV